jgi:hypothetical protein
VSTRVNAEGRALLPTQDRGTTSISSAAGARRVRVGARVHVASGAPYTPVIGAFGRVLYDPTTKRWIRDPADPQTIPAS